MFKLKQLTGIVLFLSIFFQMSVISAVELAEIEVEEKYTQELEFLKTLGIYSPMGAVNDAITQEEFMNVTAKVFGKNFDKQYFDSIGILPFSTGKFNPDKEVTYTDAIKTMVIITGFDYYAKFYGGFPEGYVRVADEQGITKDVKIENENAITRAETAKIISNALEVDILGVSSIVGANAVYEVKEDENLLKNTFNIYELKGIVERTPTLSVSAESKPQDGFAVIGGTEFEVGNVNTDDFAGMAVYGYYQKHDSDDYGKLLFLTGTTKNKVVEIQAEDIVSFSERKYVYENDGKNKNIDIAVECDIIYNYERVEPESELDIPMIPESGTIKLIDNNGDGDCDVLFINDYKSYAVDYVNLSKFAVLSKYEKGIIEIGEDDEIVKLILNGKTISIENLKNGDVLNVLENISKTKKRIVVTRETASGTVKSISTVDGEKSITLDDGNKYIFIKDITDAASDIKLGDKITLNMDINKKVAGFNVTGNEDMKLGYLVDVKMADYEMDGKAMFIMCNLDTVEQTIFYSAERVKIDNIPYNQEDVKNILNPQGGVFEARLIRYKLNADSEIKEIDTYTDNNNSLRKNADNGLLRLYNSPVSNKTTGGMQGYYYQVGHFIKPGLNAQGVLVSWKEGFYVDNTTKIFYIPENRKDFEKYEKRAYTDIKEGSKVVEAYRIGNSDYAPAIVLWYAGDGVQKNEGSTVTNRTDRVNSVTHIVTKVQKVLSDEDEIVYELTLHGVGGEIKLQTETAELIDNVIPVSKGDIIRYGVNGDNEIVGIINYAGMEKLKQTKGYNSNTSSTVEFRYIYGTAYEKFGNVVSLVTEDVTGTVSADAGYNFKIDATKTIVYDVKKGEAKQGSVQDVCDFIQSGGKDYSKMFVETSYGESKVIIIVNNL